MQLTLRTDYSLRVLIYLAQKDGELATIGEIAKFYQISRNHLVKVVHHLGNAGFLNTIRGKHGGIKLARAANLIFIGDVVWQMEPGFNVVECFTSSKQACVVAPICTLKSILQQASNEFLSLLNRYTVADTITKNEQTGQIFSMEQLLHGKPPKQADNK